MFREISARQQERTFTDTLGADQEYTGNYEVYYDSNGNQWWVGGNQIASGALSDITAADGKSFSYTFPSDQTANRGAYKLVYKTKITKDMSDIKDTVTFTNKIGGDGKEADGKVEVKPGGEAETGYREEIGCHRQ